MSYVVWVRISVPEPKNELHWKVVAMDKMRVIPKCAFA